MHSILLIVGVFLVLMILVHIIFRVVKFTLSVFLFGVALIAVLYVFQTYFGIDILGAMERSLR